MAFVCVPAARAYRKGDAGVPAGKLTALNDAVPEAGSLYYSGVATSRAEGWFPMPYRAAPESAAAALPLA